MNIVFFHSNGIVPTLGGISRTTYNLCILLRSKGHSVWMVGGADLEEGCEYDEQQCFLPNSKVNSLENTKYLCDFVRNNQINIIINQTPFSLEISHLLTTCRDKTKVKLVSCYHNSILTPIYNFAYAREYRLCSHKLNIVYSLLQLGIINRLLVKYYIFRHRKATKYVKENSDAVVLLCNGQVHEFQQMSGSIDSSNVYVIPNYMPDRKAGEMKKQNIVLWVGTFDYDIKRPDYMLRIWKKISRKHSDWHLMMLGDGVSLSEMKKMANRMSLKNVTFTGRVNPEQYYQKAKIQCVTSVHEAFPMVTIEAMAHKIPVVAFDSFTSAPDIITDESNGLLVKHFDLDMFSQSLSRLMDNSDICDVMGQKAIESVNRFSPDSIYKTWMQLLSTI